MRQFRVFGKGLAKAVSVLSRAVRKDAAAAATAAPEALYRKGVLARFAALRARKVPPDEAASALGVSLRTIRNWQRRMREDGIAGLRDESRRPHRLRQSDKRSNMPLRLAVQKMRRAYPFGKAKLGVLLRRAGWSVSDSTIGRILGDLLRRRQIGRIFAGKRRRTLGGKESRPHALRWRRPAAFASPGECVQMDTLQETLQDGRTAYIFNAVDGHSRVLWSAPAAQATAKNAAAFLRQVVADREALGAPVRSVQTDGGGEFRAEFEAECARLGIIQVVLPPRSPKWNGRVEALNGTMRRELLNAMPPARTLAELSEQVAKWRAFYNEKRPHASLAMQSPLQYLQQRPSHHQKCNML